VNVSRETKASFEGKIKYHQCGVPDTVDADIAGAGASSLRFMESSFEDPNACVLVHCASGVSRSVTIVIHYLMRKEGMAFQAALDRIRAVHPAALPNSGFLNQLEALEKRLTGRTSFGARTESCVASSSVCISRVQSWARVASVENVGWMTRTSYQPQGKGGWMTRIPSVVTAPSASPPRPPAATVVVASEASAVVGAEGTEERVGAEEVKKEVSDKNDDDKNDDDKNDDDKNDDDKNDDSKDDDAKSNSSTSLAVSDGSDASEPEDTRCDYAVATVTSPRASAAESVSPSPHEGAEAKADGGLRESIPLFWQKKPPRSPI